MKRIIFSAFLALMSLVSVWAKEYIVSTLIVTTNSGDTAEFLFSNLPEATIKGENVVISTDDGESVEYPIANVKSFTFKSEHKVGLEDITEQNGRKLTFGVTRSLVSVDGLYDGEGFEVYTLGGVRAASATSINGHAEASIESLPSGVYVIVAPGHTFKFIK